MNMFFQKWSKNLTRLEIFFKNQHLEFRRLVALLARQANKVASLASQSSLSLIRSTTLPTVRNCGTTAFAMRGSQPNPFTLSMASQDVSCSRLRNSSRAKGWEARRVGVHLGLEVVLKLQKEYPTTVETLRSLPGLVYLWIIMREERMEALRQDRWAISKEAKVLYLTIRKARTTTMVTRF